MNQIRVFFFYLLYRFLADLGVYKIYLIYHNLTKKILKTKIKFTLLYVHIDLTFIKGSVSPTPGI